MNLALIFAGGVGKRMGNSGMPKQFLKLYGKEIIVYTLEIFENNENIDGIVISCLEEKIELLKELIVKYRFKKVKSIVPGGITGQESIYNGLKELEKYYSKEGYLDFELFSKSENFLKGIKKLENAMEKNYVIVLMCAEKDPIICHRAIMISKIFSEKGYRVIHLLPNNVTITQKDIEDRLIKKFFPN